MQLRLYFDQMGQTAMKCQTFDMKFEVFNKSFSLKIFNLQNIDDFMGDYDGLYKRIKTNIMIDDHEK